MADEIVASAVFDRIREVYKLPSDAAMARHLGIYPQDIPRRREKGNVPFEAILKTCPPLDWEYLFFGVRSQPHHRDSLKAFLNWPEYQRRLFSYLELEGDDYEVVLRKRKDRPPAAEPPPEAKP